MYDLINLPASLIDYIANNYYPIFVFTLTKPRYVNEAVKHFYGDYGFRAPLLKFLVTSIVIGYLLQLVILRHNPAIDALAFAIIPVLLWLLYSLLVLVLSKLLKGAASHAQIVSICLQIIPVVYVLANFAAVISSVFVNSSFLIYFIVQGILLIIYLPLGLWLAVFPNGNASVSRKSIFTVLLSLLTLGFFSYFGFQFFEIYQIPALAGPTSIPPTDTPTPIPPTDTPTSIPPTDTPTSIPPTDTPTSIPPIDTPTLAPAANLPTPKPFGPEIANYRLRPFTDENGDKKYEIELFIKHSSGELNIITYELLEPITPGVSIPEYQKVVVRKQNEQGWFVVGPYQIWICNSSFAYSQGIRIKVTDWEINVSKPLDIIINCDIS